jgi:CheY-like chemotaxis protein
MSKPNSAGRAAPLVLVVEDNLDSREMYELALSSMGLEVVGEGDGMAALQRARDVRPDVIVTDLSMPGIDGCELAERVREDAQIGSTPILALTGWGSGNQVERALRAGCAAVIEKPCDGDTLARHIRQVLGLEAAETSR